jgi:hypothetical protein
MWKTIQIRANIQQLVQLILDMKVWWSSTYLMLDQAKQKKDVHKTFYTKIGIHCFFLQCVNAFVDELQLEEQDSTKHDKIHELKLMSEEWVWVNTFLGLLSVCSLFTLLSTSIVPNAGAP